MQALRETIHAFALAKAQSAQPDDVDIEIKLGPLDSRLQLERCAQAPELFLPPGGMAKNRLTVGIRCRHPKPWKLYVPVRIERYARVITARRHIPRGATITARDLHISRQNINRFSSGFISDAAVIIGRTAKRAIQRGETLRPGLLEAAKLIAKGDKVSIVAQGAQFSIRMSGTALRDGALGERIPVQNNSSKRTIEAKVVREGVVEVRL